MLEFAAENYDNIPELRDVPYITFYEMENRYYDVQKILGKRVTFTTFYRQGMGVDARNRVAGLVRNINKRDGQVFDIGMTQNREQITITAPEGLFVSGQFSCDGVIHTEFDRTGEEVVRNNTSFIFNHEDGTASKECTSNNMHPVCRGCWTERQRKIHFAIMDHKRGSSGIYCKGCAEKLLSEEQVSIICGLVDIHVRKDDGKRSRGYGFRSYGEQIITNGYTDTNLVNLQFVSVEYFDDLVDSWGERYDESLMTATFTNRNGDLIRVKGTHLDYRNMFRLVHTDVADHLFTGTANLISQYKVRGKWVSIVENPFVFARRVYDWQKER